MMATNMRNAVIALSLVLLLLVSCAPKQRVTPPAVQVIPPAVPITQPAASVASGVIEVDSFDQDLSELDKLDADLKELETIG